MILRSSLNTHFRKKSVLCNSRRVISLSPCPTNKECGHRTEVMLQTPACVLVVGLAVLPARCHTSMVLPWFSRELREDGRECSLRAPWTPSLVAAGKLEIGSYKRRWYILYRVLLELPCLQLAQTQRPLWFSRIIYFCGFAQRSRTAIFSVLSF